MLTHRVKKGDTLGGIAQQYYGSPSRYPLIVAANRIADPDRLVMGQELIIPDAAAAAPWDHLGAEGCARLLEVGAPLAAAIVDAGGGGFLRK